METVVILGCGIVGRSWAMLFASHGHKVRLYDPVPEALTNAPDLLRIQMTELASKGQLLEVHKFPLEQQLSLIQPYASLGEALNGATYLQESGPENLQTKHAIFMQLDELTKGNNQIIFATSSSTIPASKITEGLDIATRTLVVHPVNPPYFVRLVELVANPKTNPDVLTKVRHLMTTMGRKPIVITREIPGFGLNRIQYTILNEMWRLVADGTVSVQDADLIMTEGLAPRYIFTGPLETAVLNAHGWIDYCQRYAEVINQVSNTFGPTPFMDPNGQVSKSIDDQIQAFLPNDHLSKRKNWRDENLARLSQFKANNVPETK